MTERSSEAIAAALDAAGWPNQSLHGEAAAEIRRLSARCGRLVDREMTLTKERSELIRQRDHLSARCEELEQASAKADEFGSGAVDQMCRDDAKLQALEARCAALEQAVRAAAQFLDPKIPRGHDSAGWENTCSMVACALSTPSEEPQR